MANFDLVVVGSGAAGLTAALSAAVEGAKVAVLEASDQLGGTSAWSGGGMWLPDNGLDPDFSDSIEEAKTYLLKLTGGRVKEALIDRYLEEARKIPTFLSEHTPLTFRAEIGRPDYHAPWPGSSNTSRTVFPGMYELPRLGALADKVRDPAPGSIPPIEQPEIRAFEAAGDRMGWKKLAAERAAAGIALRGRALVGGLLEGCVNLGVTFILETRARELIVDEGAVVGVRAEHDSGMVAYRSPMGVVLAAGGFEWNREMWDALIGAPYDGPASPPTNQGDGLIMAARVGAKLANLNKATWIPSRWVGEVFLGEQYVRTGFYGSTPGEILVNRAGRRFTNEALNYNDIGNQLTSFDTHTYEFPNSPSFAIGDRRVRQAVAYLGSEAMGVSDAGDGFFEADTLRELAEKLEIDPDGLEAQVAEFNEGAREGKDPAFHRGEKPWEGYFLPKSDLPNRSIAPIVDAPFVGYRVRATVFGTKGGPVIDENAQIVDFAGKAIPGLFGAGNNVASPFGWSYPGGGGTLGPAVTCGRIAGISAVHGTGNEE